jgi:hypothetical protein
LRFTEIATPAMNIRTSIFMRYESNICHAKPAGVGGLKIDLRAHITPQVLKLQKDLGQEMWMTADDDSIPNAAPKWRGTAIIKGMRAIILAGTGGGH